MTRGTQEATRPTRLYAMTKLEAGHWLLPGNDAKTLWRIRAYDEDGSLQRTDAAGNWVPVTGRRWEIYRYTGGSIDAVGLDDIEDPYKWQQFEDGFLTRAEAAEAAVRNSPAAEPVQP